MIQKQIELLAPAGSYESMKAAVAAGADAVYIGGSKFGARAFADNPKEDRLLEAIDYVHLYGRKLYMTVNTLMKEEEMSQLYDYLYPYYCRGLDAVIVQDMGVFAFVRRYFPNLPIHASTQMTITGVHGAKLLKELGAERIVTARELSLSEIETIHREADVEIESFVHGALCYSYSGQCLFSSLIGGRSGNRGRCAQTCRLPFDVLRDGKMLNDKNSRYPLSLKDLCTLDLIPDMIEAGIYSMKIEGRMKSPRYTAGVVSVYRKYVDLYLKKGRDGYLVEGADRRLLQDLFDRGGQTDGYYTRHNGRDMVVWKEKPSFREGNEALFQYLDQTFVERETKEEISGLVSVELGKPVRLTLRLGDVEIETECCLAEAAKNQPMDEEKIRRQLEKTGNTPFHFEKLEVSVTGDVFVPIQALNELRRNGLEALRKAILSAHARSDGGAGNDSGARNDGTAGIEGIAFPIGDEAGGRVWSSRPKCERDQLKISVSLENKDCLDAVLDEKDVNRLYLDAAEFPAADWKKSAERCHAAQKECMLTLPHIFRAEAVRFFEKWRKEFLLAGFDGVLVRSLEEVYFMKELAEYPMVFDYGMYGMNRMAQEQLLALGAAELTWPVECNSRELEKLPVSGELIVYGRLPMMVTAQCIHKATEGCDKKGGVLWLKDRMGKEFPVKNHCRFCYNTIYNTAPVSLLGLEDLVCRIAPSGIRLQLTTETPVEAKKVIGCFGDRYRRHQETELPFADYTRGHFKRGVE